ncbi:MOSC domain-containing protein [Parvibaculum sp.]|uniref:MOSC domain-containing protein n=1 Tax=Parvibaculum sp. TaxID=2024848 RepID=UPI003210AAD1
MTGSARIAGLYRYPVKGLSPEAMQEAALRPGETIDWDRAFAIENGSADFDPAAPKHFPKVKFLMLMKNERLARLHSRFDERTATLTLSENGRQVVSGNLMTVEGRTAIEAFMAQYMKAELRGAPRIVHAPGFSISDVAAKVVSLINLASVRELEKLIGRPVDPLRFRGNLLVQGLSPWEDHDWAGREIRLGEIRARGVMPIRRCAATNVDPSTAERDMEIPATLQRNLGHMNLGLYAEVLDAGTIRPGDRIALV